jgi:6,7-dimethyl-8-ribityllumazine synthase
MEMKSYEGSLIARDLKFSVVISRFNEFISKSLLEGALDCLKRHGGKEENIDIAWTPGSYEIPLVARRLAATRKYDAVIALGVIIRGETPHFEYIASETAKGIARVSLDAEIPVSFGIITADSLEQAIERAGTKSGNKGFQAALSAIEMANLLKSI